MSSCQYTSVLTRRHLNEYNYPQAIDEEDPEEEPTTEEPTTEEPTTEEPIEGEKTELQILQEEIGVLPEVGNNIASTLYIVITTITIIVAFGGVYYINKKDVK